MSLIDGGAMSAAQRAAEAGNQADDEAVITTSQKVVLDALTAYLQVQRFDLKKQIAHKATEVVAEISKAEARRVALGVSGDNDLNMAASRRRAGGRARVRLRGAARRGARQVPQLLQVLAQSRVAARARGTDAMAHRLAGRGAAPRRVAQH